METVGPTLNTHSLIGLDTSIFVYVFEDSPVYADIAGGVLRQVEAGASSAITSTISLMEILVRPQREGRPDIADTYEVLLNHFRNLQIATINAQVARQAAIFRAEYNLKPADSLQVAACSVAGATAFVTNDKRLRKISGIEIIVLDDYIQ